MEDSSINDTCLLFDSHFEGGNLLCAFKSKKQLNTYTLFMQNDTNTYGYNQWFYFSIRNMKVNTKYTFRIANFVSINLCRKNHIPSLIMDFNPFFFPEIKPSNKEMGGIETVWKSAMLLPYFLRLVVQNITHQSLVFISKVQMIMYLYLLMPLTVTAN